MASTSIDSTVSGPCFCRSSIREPTTSASSISTASASRTARTSFAADCTSTVNMAYPMKLMFNLTGTEGTSSRKRPSKSVEVPVLLPWTMTLAAKTGSPVSPSRTCPRITSCANTGKERTLKNRQVAHVVRRNWHMEIRIAVSTRPLNGAARGNMRRNHVPPPCPMYTRY